MKVIENCRRASRYVETQAKLYRQVYIDGGLTPYEEIELLKEEIKRLRHDMAIDKAFSGRQ